MSLLMFNLGPEQVAVVTDTLATSTNGDPSLYVSKCIAVPHLNMVIAGTGLLQLGCRWASFVLERMVCRDIEMLDRHAPNGIAQVWKDLEAEHGTIGGTSTIYHFGQAEDSKRYVGYAYRSTDGFVSESLGYGFGVKPPPSHDFEASGDLQEWIALAKTIRSEQDLLPPEQRLYVGGALALTMLQGGVVTTTEIYRFDDFDDMWADMGLRLLAEG